MALVARTAGIIVAIFLVAGMSPDGSESKQTNEASPSSFQIPGKPAIATTSEPPAKEQSSSRSHVADKTKAAAPFPQALKAAPPTRVSRSGKIRKTGHALDIAIEGEGYFQLTPADDSHTRETYVTRSGRFEVDNQNRIVLHGQKRDWILTPSLRLPVESALIEITTDGLFWVTDIKDLEKPDDNRMMIGNIQLIVPADCSFTPCGDGVFVIRWNGKHHPAWIGTPGIEGRGELRQACLEGSNVDPREELEELQKLQRQSDAPRTGTSTASSAGRAANRISGRRNERDRAIRAAGEP
jgi:flagellar basal body rod protein FlgG